MDKLGDRQKEYENTFGHNLPNRTNVMIRIDGKAFHSYTKNCKKPFDDELMEDMDNTAIELCENIQGAKLAYVQSDEISIWVTDYDKLDTNPWFGNNIQKMVSVSASIATAKFNTLRLKRFLKVNAKNVDDPISKEVLSGFVNEDIDKYNKLAHFDSRIWVLPNLSEVANSFLWRQNDCSRNSLQMLARSHFSHKELENKNSPEIHDLLYSKKINWNDLDARYKRGRLIMKFEEVKRVELKDKKEIGCIRNVWKSSSLNGFNFEFWFNIIKDLSPKEY